MRRQRGQLLKEEELRELMPLDVLLQLLPLRGSRLNCVYRAVGHCVHDLPDASAWRDKERVIIQPSHDTGEKLLEIRLQFAGSLAEILPGSADGFCSAPMPRRNSLDRSRSNTRQIRPGDQPLGTRLRADQVRVPCKRREALIRRTPRPRLRRSRRDLPPRLSPSR